MRGLGCGHSVHTVCLHATSSAFHSSFTQLSRPLAPLFHHPRCCVALLRRRCLCRMMSRRMTLHARVVRHPLCRCSGVWRGCRRWTATGALPTSCRCSQGSSLCRVPNALRLWATVAATRTAIARCGCRSSSSTARVEVRCGRRHLSQRRHWASSPWGRRSLRPCTPRHRCRNRRPFLRPVAPQPDERASVCCAGTRLLATEATSLAQPSSTPLRRQTCRLRCPDARCWRHRPRTIRIVTASARALPVQLPVPVAVPVVAA
jgi:hypothetical protein